MLNIFKLTDELIQRKYRIPTFNDTKIGKWDESEGYQTYANGTIELYELLDKLRSEYIKLYNTNVDLKNDLRTVTHNGSISWVCDSYFNNRKEVDESLKIKEKWFGKKE